MCGSAATLPSGFFVTSAGWIVGVSHVASVLALPTVMTVPPALAKSRTAGKVLSCVTSPSQLRYSAGISSALGNVVR